MAKRRNDDADGDKWKRRAVASGRREANRADQTYLLAIEAHKLSNHPAMPEQEKEAQLEKIKTAIKKNAPLALRQRGFLKRLFASKSDSRWLLLAIAAMNWRAELGGVYDEKAAATFEDLARLIEGLQAEADSPPEQKLRRRIARQPDPPHN